MDQPHTLSHSLAAFAVGLTYEDVPAEVVESATWRVLDILGTGIAATGLPGPTVLINAVRSWRSVPEATILGCPVATSAPLAALANGTLGHALDFDDTHHASRIHVSTVVVPAAVAAAEAAGSSGKELLVALVAGFESAVRLGIAAPGRAHDRGFHATSVYGGCGSVVAAGRLAHLDQEELINALGTVASTASGLREAYLAPQGATDTKALHAGWAARAGVEAATLAKAGFTGPRTAFEGRFGLLNAFLMPEPFDDGPVRADLGEQWHTPDIVYKLYPCGSLIHAGIAAALELRSRYELDPAVIDSIVCIMPPGVATTVLEPEGEKLAPNSGYAAKFSAQYAITAALVDGYVVEESFDVDRRPKSFWELLRRTRYELDPSMPFPKKNPGGLRVTLIDGRVLENRHDNSPGSSDRPASVEDVTTKFRGNVRGVLSESAAEEVIERVLALAAEPTVREVMALCKQRVR